MVGTLAFLCEVPRLVFSGGSHLLLSDAGFLTREAAEIVELGATHLTDFVDDNALNVGAGDGEDALYAHGAAHLADSETLLVAMAADLDAHATVLLYALLVTLDNFVSYGDGVACLELGVGLARSKCFFSNFDEICHCCKWVKLLLSVRLGHNRELCILPATRAESGRKGTAKK